MKYSANEKKNEKKKSIFITIIDYYKIINILTFNSIFISMLVNKLFYIIVFYLYNYKTSLKLKFLH